MASATPRPAGSPTVTPGLTITAAQSDEIFARDLVKYEATVNKSVEITLADHEFDACVSLCYNIGQGAFAGSTLVRRLNSGDRSGVGPAISMWEKNTELVSRREAERSQFETPYTKALPVARVGERADQGARTRSNPCTSP